MRGSLASVAFLALVVGCGGSTENSSGSGGKDGGAGTGAAGSGGSSSGGTSSGGTSTGGGGAPGGFGGSGGDLDASVKLCGGLMGATCAADEFCDYPATSLCGGDDSPGECVKKPTDCPKNCTDTCGCDGQVYCNACMAQMSGTDDTSLTFCGQDAGGKQCGGVMLIPCAADEWCDWPNGCGGADVPGQCKKRPQGCPADCPGVCGCDGKTYCNACGANAQGVDTSTTNSCSKGDGGQGTSCGSDFECQPGLKCCYPCGIPGCSNACIPPDPGGNCPMFP